MLFLTGLNAYAVVAQVILQQERNNIESRRRLTEKLLTV